jgi:hypothetical protein
MNHRNTHGCSDLSPPHCSILRCVTPLAHELPNAVIEASTINRKNVNSRIVPMLALSVRQCGESLNQSVLGRLTPKPLTTSNITPRALFRCVKKFSPTLIVDECDAAFNNNSELRELINASHLRSQAYVWRCVGDSHEPAIFHTWAPKCLALIGNLPDKERALHM